MEAQLILDMRNEIRENTSLLNQATKNIAVLTEMLFNTERNSEDAAKYLGISEATLRRKRQAALIGYRQKGRNFYYAMRHLIDYQNRHENKPLNRA